MKRIAVIVLCVLLATVTSAQIQIGIKGGLNLSDVAINNYANPDVEPAYQIKPGVLAGVFFGVQGASDLGLLAEVQYSNKGVKAFSNVNLHYVCVPLLLQYHFHKNFYAEAGPEFGYLVTAHSKHGNANNTWNNKLDLGLDAGLQFRPGKLHFGIRFNAGFSSVIRNTDVAVNGERVRYLNRALQFSIAYPIADLAF